MYAQRGEGLRGALAESDVAEAGRLRRVEDVLDGIRDVVPGELIDGEVPKLGAVRAGVDGLLRVLVASIVAQPHIKACTSS